MKKILALLLTATLFFAVACSANPTVKQPSTSPTASATESGGTTKSSFIYSTAMKLDWNYSIYLPKGYDEPANEKKEYPVIYLLHGGYGTHAGYLQNFDLQARLDKMIADGTLPETIVVFPDGFISYYVNGPALNMEDAVIQDLIPTMEQQYRIDSRKECRVIGGLSNGAYGASRFALKYPQLFSGAFLMSPAVWEIPENAGVLRMHIYQKGDSGFDQETWDSFHPTRYFDDYVKANSPVDFYITTGTEDTVTTVEMIKTFSDKLSAVTSVQMLTHPGAHDNPFWDTVMDDCLTYAGSILKQ